MRIWKVKVSPDECFNWRNLCNQIAKCKVILNGNSSRSFFTNAAIPQSSLLGPTLFLIYINDILYDIISQLCIYADDRAIYSCLDSRSDQFDKVEWATDLKIELQSVVNWLKELLVNFN